MAIDPVCGMTVDEKTAPATAVHNGTTYYFCAPGCKRTFEKDPETVLKGRSRGMGHAPVQMVTMTPLRAKAADQGRGENKITEAGKSATLTIPIEGMSCASCVAKIEHGLSAVPGVSRAAVIWPPSRRLSSTGLGSPIPRRSRRPFAVSATHRLCRPRPRLGR